MVGLIITIYGSDDIIACINYKNRSERIDGIGLRRGMLYCDDNLLNIDASYSAVFSNPLDIHHVYIHYVITCETLLDLLFSWLHLQEENELQEENAVSTARSTGRSMEGKKQNKRGF